MCLDAILPAYRSFASCIPIADKIWSSDRPKAFASPGTRFYSGPGAPTNRYGGLPARNSTDGHGPAISVLPKASTSLHLYFLTVTRVSAWA